MQITGERIYLKPFQLSDVNQKLAFHLKNKSFFAGYSTERDECFYTLEEQQALILRLEDFAASDVEYYYGIFLKDTDDLIGTINLFSILRESLQSAFIGYFLDKEHNGNGYATEAVKLMVDFGFDILGLHRIEAGVMPKNERSKQVLLHAGFHLEGLAVKNVRINGTWEDHQVLAIINPEDVTN
ncbi:GNAT family N-acetyltransferase [Listeria ivanovii]|uniref:GNAT family N-acetyltransferase n=2 Tax=Listeria ivanovii TaxID=1638 RepID=A0ABS1G6B4_LISIV|nr:GNAT family protein [Listeria ivanovii]EFR96669.1 putative ribosomal-protein-alanine N-acetyltransferase YjcK [Listeria ivanovii FSL F6-596]AIS60104.1 alanine acetyltransferase [Listeria ivanovii subsp. londoniensis]AIS62929.1 alanine acetyltransferase [Listeria ivanovii subsp. londoniensis]MBC2256174.1 GNAT family N-acetyltransferase [Listeria ivanovii]MBK1962424.1 GNAT family N-acetyltransferase [Listeria ivanovii subsp. londoniensis]